MGDLERLRRWETSSLAELRSHADLFVVPWGGCADTITERAASWGAEIVAVSDRSLEGKRSAAVTKLRDNHRRYDLVGFIDDDAYLEPYSCAILLNHARENPTHGAFGCEAYDDAGVRQVAGHTFLRGYATDLAHVPNMEIPPRRFVCACSCNLFVRVDALELLLKHAPEIWDARFERFGTCHDFGLRLHLLGIRMSMVPSARVIHTGFPARLGGGPRRELVRMLRSNLLLFHKFLVPPDAARATDLLRERCNRWRSSRWPPFAETLADALDAFDEANCEVHSLRSGLGTSWSTLDPELGREALDIGD